MAKGLLSLGEKIQLKRTPFKTRFRHLPQMSHRPDPAKPDRRPVSSSSSPSSFSSSSFSVLQVDQLQLPLHLHHLHLHPPHPLLSLALRQHGGAHVAVRFQGLVVWYPRRVRSPLGRSGDAGGAEGSGAPRALRLCPARWATLPRLWRLRHHGLLASCGASSGVVGPVSLPASGPQGDSRAWGTRRQAAVPRSARSWTQNKRKATRAPSAEGSRPFFTNGRALGGFTVLNNSARGDGQPLLHGHAAQRAERADSLQSPGGMSLAEFSYQVRRPHRVLLGYMRTRSCRTIGSAVQLHQTCMKGVVELRLEHAQPCPGLSFQAHLARSALRRDRDSCVTLLGTCRLAQADQA
ncbi:hypothetical protein Cadr_000018041 [Camelus dromedarius]|uniref:Uncharacterized protein n=1 Tax=Camelus dromedarius TaxID=9838 RepID=A0A5N4D6S6_CAMDR|nr:hypothetical protein Cadr_000018041 [Camelus dromedarius]